MPRRMRAPHAALAALVAALGGPGLGATGAAAQQAAAYNDYPTETRADYVFACMMVNGQTREMLRRCSCSIDVVASILPYERYVEAEAVLRLRQTSGERITVFRTAEEPKAMVSDLRRAQAEAEIRCFD